MFEVNEKSTAYLAVTCLDKLLAAAAPATFTYRVDCESTGAALVPDTPLTPDVNMELVVPADANAIQEPTNAFEYRLVTMTATYSGGEQVTTQYRYRVRNLTKIT